MLDYKFSIDAIKVNKTFFKKKSRINALVDFNIQIPKGSIYGLLGPNGAGKSTFINILGGLVNKNEGKISICGIDIDTNSKLSKKKIGIVPQELNIDPFFTPYELLELQAGLYGIPKKQRNTEEILHNVGLFEQRDAYARTLSGGMRRRLLVAKAIVHNPEMLILDEPTAGVDVGLRKNLWENVKLLHSQGVTIILTTHYLEEAEEMCDRIGILSKGNLVALDSTKNLLNKIQTKKVTFKLDGPAKINNEKLSSLKVLSFKENEISFSYEKNKIKMEEIINLIQKDNVKILDISTNDADLEDVFLGLTKNK